MENMQKNLAEQMMASVEGGKSVVANITDNIRNAILGEMHNIIKVAFNKLFDDKINEIGLNEFINKQNNINDN